MCNKCVWRVKYNSGEMMIYGVRKFMNFYGVKPFSFVQFDYYGDSMFVVSIFEENAVECVYPQSDPRIFFKMEESKYKYKKDLMIKRGTIEYEKSAALFLCNGVKNVSEIYEINMKDSYFAGSMKQLVSTLCIEYIDLLNAFNCITCQFLMI